MTSVHVKRDHLDTETCIGLMWRWRRKICMMISPAKDHQRLPANGQEVGGRYGTDALSLRTFWNQSWRLLWDNFCVSHPVCGALFWQLDQTSTVCMQEYIIMRLSKIKRVKSLLGYYYFWGMMLMTKSSSEDVSRRHNIIWCSEGNH